MPRIKPIVGRRFPYLIPHLLQMSCNEVSKRLTATGVDTTQACMLRQMSANLSHPFGANAPLHESDFKVEGKRSRSLAYSLS